MSYQTLALIISFTINICQYVASWHKQNQAYKLDQSRLQLDKQKHNDDVAEKQAVRDFLAKEKERDYKFRLDSQNAAHQHELEKLRFNESIEVHHSLVPQLQNIFSDYIAITTKEINESNFPIPFSSEQLKQEKIVCLYCPDVIEDIELMKSFNDTNTTDASKDSVLRSLTDNVVPTLATYLSQLPKQETDSEQ